jgi:hypothetical protein
MRGLNCAGFELLMTCKTEKYRSDFDFKTRRGVLSAEFGLAEWRVSG